MKLTEIINNNQCSLSFEVFPPKRSDLFDSVKTAVEVIARLRPSFMSVTYGAGGGTSSYTLDIAKDIKERFNVPTMAHLTCVSSTKETVASKIQEIKEAGIVNVMALRGDLTPELEHSDRSKWAYHHAIDLVRELKEADADFCIGCACYPEVHPESRNQAEDIKYLKEKVDAGCDFITTQMFFDNNLLYNFIYKDHADHQSGTARARDQAIGIIYPSAIQDTGRLFRHGRRYDDAGGYRLCDRPDHRSVRKRHQERPFVYDEQT